VLEYRQSDENNRWIIAPNWEVKKVTIRKDAKVVYDRKSHALGVITRQFRFSASSTEQNCGATCTTTTDTRILWHCTFDSNIGRGNATGDSA
jgi:hypothetical protein